MYQQSLTPTLDQTNFLDALVASLSARPAAAILATPTVHLFTAGPGVLPDILVFASFTEATFTGYAAVALAALVGPVNSPSNTCRAAYQNANFTAGALSASQAILGYWVDNGAGLMYAAEIFVAPVLIVLPGDFLDLAVMLGAPHVPSF